MRPKRSFANFHIQSPCLGVPKTLDHMSGCQNYGPFLGTLNIRGRIIIGTQKGTIILTTSHMGTIQHRTSKAVPASICHILSLMVLT